LLELKWEGGRLCSQAQGAGGTQAPCQQGQSICQGLRWDGSGEMSHPTQPFSCPGHSPWPRSFTNERMLAL
jgi:hypothetical protein